MGFKRKTRDMVPDIPTEAERGVVYDPYREMGAEVLQYHGDD
jgi:hypothetical protein